MNRISRRNLFIVSCITLFSRCSSSCNSSSEYEKPRAVPIKMDAIDRRIISLIDSGAINPLGVYSKSNNVIVRLIESNQLSATEITVTSNINGAMNVMRRCIDYSGKNIEYSNRMVLQAEAVRLNTILKTLRRIKPDIALRAYPQAIDSGDYLIEVYYNGEHIAYLRSGFSAGFSGDLDNLRSLMFHMVLR